MRPLLLARCTSLAALLGLAACAPIASTGPDDGIDDSLTYPADQAHSPLTKDVVERLQQIVVARAPERRRTFAKIGDSITVSPSFAMCLAASTVHVDAARAVAEGTTEAQLEAARLAFKDSTLAGDDSYRRKSLSATTGWMANDALKGSPNALEKELDASGAAFAVIMYGTNDSWTNAPSPGDGSSNLRSSLNKIVATTLAKGVVPILSTIPARADNQKANEVAVKINAIIREIAEQNRVPLMDLWLRMSKLPKLGLGPDGIHPNSAADSCGFSSTQLAFGYNQRNLLLLEELDRMKRLIVDPLDKNAPNAPNAPSAPNAIDCAPLSGSGARVPVAQCDQDNDRVTYQCDRDGKWVKLPDENPRGPAGDCTAINSHA